MKYFALILALALCGCGKRTANITATQAVVGSQDLQQVAGRGFFGDTAYAIVQSESLPAFYDDFRAELFDKGVTKWDLRFDCNHFATYYAALAQTRFYLANFHSASSPQSLAIGVVWFPTQRGWHAAVAAITERGLLFIEPQSGKEFPMPDEQRVAAIFMF